MSMEASHNFCYHLWISSVCFILKTNNVNKLKFSFIFHFIIIEIFHMPYSVWFIPAFWDR